MLKELFPNARFRAAASEAAIAAVEASFGFRLPEQLRRLYLECDGFRENRGNAQYLYPLTEGDSSLVSITRFLWLEIDVPDLKPFFFFGSSGGDEYWGIDPSRSDKIIAWCHLMEDQYEIAGTDIIKVWQADFAGYDKLV